MKNKRFLLLIFLFSLSFSACGLNNSQSMDKENISGRRTGDFGQPDFGQPDSVADISGIVKSITGNEVKVLKIERPQRMENTENGEASKDNNQTTAEGGENGSATKKAVSLTGAMDGSIPRGAMGGGFDGMRNPEDRTDANDSSEFLERMKSMSTGEDVVIIPVGIRMLKTEIGEDGKPVAVEASLADIKANTMISVWIDKNMIESATGSTTTSESEEIKQANFVLIKQ
jgi:hypothetical protein